MLDWRTLLSAHRWRGEPAEPVDPGRSPFQKDFDRIVFSSAFRRLQDKTQVHPRPDSDYVRTRLTHSLEVASVGRSLAAAVGQAIAARHRLPEGMGAAGFGHIVSAACLAHDIGNPPFGHYGEALIRDWFADSAPGRAALSGLSEGERLDMLGFEGNAQGFRILTRLQTWSDDGGMRLTAAVLGAFTKYPRLSNAPPPESPTGSSAPVSPPVSLPAGQRKFGVMQAEAVIFRELAAVLGLPEERPGCWRRHPLAWLVEAADDICYSIVDLEDGHKLGKLGFDQVADLLRPIIGADMDADMDGGARRIDHLRAKAIGRLVEQAVTVFLDLEPEILAGRVGADLMAATPAAPALAEIARVTARDVFVGSSEYKDHLGADRAIAHLLARRMAESSRDGYQRALDAADFVSGMTDGYALHLYGQDRRKSSDAEGPDATETGG